jgi:DNA-binding MarR family transcriptional regulator
VNECADGELNAELLDAFAELIGRFLGEGEKVAERLGVPVFALKAMHFLGGGMPMKELGRRLRCDPSFVTAIADSLEKRGLAKREPNPGDRRIKNLVLTPEGSEFRNRVEQEMLASMPWCTALDRDERATLLALIRKLIAATTQGPAHSALSPQTKEVDALRNAPAAARSRAGGTRS